MGLCTAYTEDERSKCQLGTNYLLQRQTLPMSLGTRRGSPPTGGCCGDEIGKRILGQAGCTSVCVLAVLSSVIIVIVCPQQLPPVSGSSAKICPTR